jgi:hypothetical protein
MAFCSNITFSGEDSQDSSSHGKKLSDFRGIRSKRIPRSEWRLHSSFNIIGSQNPGKSGTIDVIVILFTD